MDSETSPIQLPVVRDEPLKPRIRRPVRALLLHIVRVAIFVGVLTLLRHQHRKFLAHEAARKQEPVSVGVLSEFFPDASEGGSFDQERRTQQVVNEAGEPLGYVLQTSPESDHIVGFSGPTNLLIAFTTDDRIAGLKVLWTRDTADHLELIQREESFLQSWNGKSWDEAASSPDIDGVSGATLTSFSIAEAIATRLGGKPPSLKFPDNITVAELKELFPDANGLTPEPIRPALLQVQNSAGELLGYVFRTSPFADNVVGYQGPTDTLVALSPQEQLLGIRVRKSFDNEPYVRYVREEDYFLNLFNTYTLDEVAKLDLFEARVEGVSGATMTSLAVADALIEAARKARTKVEPATAASHPPLLGMRDLTSISVVMVGLLIGFTRLRRHRRIRLALQLIVIGVLGILNADMLSQAVVVGWAQNGIPWRLATGLVVVAGVALVVPAVSKQQTYCHQICPHGALQQLLKNRLSWKWSLPVWLRVVLSAVPVLLLGWCLAVGMLHLRFSLVDIEPFDAWVFQAAGTATVSLAIVGLTASLFVPMAYCRYGCPTGALLDYLRFNARSDCWSLRDWIGISLLGLAAALSLVPPSLNAGQIDVLSLSGIVREWLDEHRAAMWWLAATSLIMFVGTLIAVPWLAVRIPADYFTRASDAPIAFRNRHPAISLAWRVVKNVIGGIFFLAGLAMLLLPGQGLLTILLGIMLIDFPGKRRFEILLIRRPSISRAINWMRDRAGQKPLQMPPSRPSELHENDQRASQ